MYDAPKRSLVFPLYDTASNSSVVPEDTLCDNPSGAVIFPEDPNERVLVPFLLSLNEYNVLANAVDVGADIAYGVDAQAVIWLWLRNFMCADTICDWLRNCVTEPIQTQDKLIAYGRQQCQSAAAQIQYAADYTGDPSSINDHAPDDYFSGGGTTGEELALCAAINAYVRSFAYAKIQQLDAVYAFGAGVLLLAFFLSGGLAFALMIASNIAIGGAVLAGGLTYLAARGALSDNAALSDVVCCMYDALNGTAISCANWETSLDSCGFTSGTNEAIVRDFVADSLADNCLTFYDFLGEARRAQEAGNPLDCPCDAGAFAPLSITTDDCFGTSFSATGGITYVSENMYDVEVSVPVTGGYAVHIKEASDQSFSYRRVSGAVNASVVLNNQTGTPECHYSGNGGGAIDEGNQALLELSLYRTSAQGVGTIRIRFGEVGTIS